MKKIKLFENYTKENYEKELVDFLYSKIEESQDYDDNLINESEGDDEPPLSSGERAAMARDFQIITPSQLAAIYLKALGKSEGEEGAYLVMIDGIKDFGDFDTDTRAFTITNPALADAIDLESVGTIYRTVNKFVNLIDGVGETQGESLYPKVIKAFEKFSTMNPVQISNIAAEAIQNPDESTKNRDKALASNDLAARRREEKNRAINLIGQKIYSLINSLKRESIFFAEGKAQKAAISRVSKEIGEPEEVVKDYYKKYLISKKMLNRLNFYDK